MAKTVPNTYRLPRRRTGPAPKYPWDKWLDGQRWRLVRGRDYTIATRSIVELARYHARQRGKRLVSQSNGSTVVLRAVRR